MAGLTLAIEMRRRRIQNRKQHFQEDNPHHSHPSYRSLLEPPPPIITTATSAAAMDEAALKARQRLEEKLGCFRPSSSRLNRVEANEGRGNNSMRTRDNHNHGYLVTRIPGRRWHFQINTSKSKGQLCAVCLEDFHVEKQVMQLSCTHKYHSDCLLPWLVDHPNCPSCRTPVPL
ncbi:RING-H2 finger protein ATL70-like isoform X1 [Camellia sinensis]|uniref:RING-type domain-containing protein n=1 Tax=Camellia sinensis var. sinensis TaxID=542762 RepID=A0A4S4EPM2_CAMSN|nr:RING-H2 finger protein ATL70-like isoform X1 [Camellia sinensis]THG18693.1 hypothetical protein TEA_022502 [Camellia sinensis var. sinensis]